MDFKKKYFYLLSILPFLLFFCFFLITININFKLSDFVFVAIFIIIYALVILDLYKVCIDKKRAGKFIFKIKSTSNFKKYSSFIILLIFDIMLLKNVLLFNTIINSFMLFLCVSITILLFVHSFSNNGISDNGVFFSGIFIPWKEILKCKIDTEFLIFWYNEKLFRINCNYKFFAKIIFKDQIKLENFLKQKTNM